MSENSNYFEEIKEDFKETQELLYAPDLNTPPTAEYKEERGVKKLSNLVGFSFLAMSLVAIAVQLILLPLNYIPFKENSPVSLLAEAGVSQVYQIIFTLTVFTLPFIVCYKLADYRISDLVSFSKTPKGKTMPLVVFGIAFCSFANIASAYLSEFFSMLGFDYTTTNSRVPEGFSGFILSVLATAVFPALMEEFAVRGIIMGSLRKYGDTFALVTSSFCFGVLHGNFAQMPFAFLVGLFLGFSVLKTNSLRVAIIVHFINNFVSVLLDYWPDALPTELKNAAFIVYMLATFAFAVFFLSRTENAFFSMNKSETLISDSKKYKYFFLSGGVVIFVIYNLIRSAYILF